MLARTTLEKRVLESPLQEVRGGQVTVGRAQQAEGGAGSKSGLGLVGLDRWRSKEVASVSLGAVSLGES